MSQQGRALTPEVKNVIVQLKSYFDRTKLDIDESARASIERISSALDVGFSHISGGNRP